MLQKEFSVLDSFFVVAPGCWGVICMDMCVFVSLRERFI